jgi:hypothetical protein
MSVLQTTARSFRASTAACWILLVAMSMLTACGGGGGGGNTATPGTPAPEATPEQLAGQAFFPVDFRARWVYSDGANTTVTRFAGTEVLPSGANVSVLLESSLSGQVIDRSFYEVRNDGVYLHPGPNADAFMAAIGASRVLAFPVQAGTSFVQFDGPINGDFDNDGRSDPTHVRSVVDAVELAPCSSGPLRFDVCLHQRISVTATTTLSRNGQVVRQAFVDHEWYAPGVGRVRTSSDTVGEPPEVLIAYRVGEWVSDRAAPLIATRTPEANSTVAGSLLVSVTFDEAIDPTSINESMLRVRTQSGQDVPGRSVFGTDGVLRFEPEQGWVGGRYQAQLQAGVADLIGNLSTSVSQWPFEVDTTSPALVSRSPAIGSVSIGPTDPIRWSFSEPLNPASVNGAEVTLVNPNRTDLVTRIQLEVDGAVLTMTPLDPLLPATEYTATFGTGLTDLVGNPLEAVATSQILTAQGRFAYPQRFVSARKPDSMAAGDIDGDGRIDLVYNGAFAPDEFSGRLFVQRGLASGGWGMPEMLDDQECHAQGAVVVADLDGNGLADVARVGCGLRVQYQRSDGTLGPVQQISNLVNGILRAADLNADGRTDLVAVQFGGSSFRVWLQNAAGQLLLQVDQDLGFPRFGGVNGLIDLGTRALDVGDVNGDGRPDIVATLGGDTDPRSLMIVLQQADGSWAEPRYQTQGGGRSLTLGDLNGDGRLDLALMGGYMLQQADGSFGAFISFPNGLAFSTYAVALADVDGDGRLDVISRSLYNGVMRVMVQLQQAGGTLALPQAYLSDGCGDSYNSLLALDLDGNGLIDVIDGDSWLMQMGNATTLSTPSGRVRSVVAANATVEQPVAPVAALRSKLRTRWGR